MSFLTWAVLAACAISVVTDTRFRRIPNAITFGLAAIVFIVRATEGVGPLVGAVVGFVIVFLIGMLAFSSGWLGGGDVKLIAAGAAAFGWPDAVGFMLYTAIAGGIFALLYAGARGRAGALLGYVRAQLQPIVSRGAVSPVATSMLKFPYAVAIASGAVLVALSHTAVPMLRLPL